MNTTNTIQCDDCGGLFPTSEKVKGDYFYPGDREDGVTVWVCKWCSFSIKLYRQAETIEMIRGEAEEEHNKNCPDCGGGKDSKDKDDKDPKPPLPFPRLVN
jgi:rubrerythrin